MFTHQQRCICGICTPAKMSIEQFLLRELWQKGRDGFPDADFRRIGVSICRVLSSRPRHRDAFRCFCTERLMLLEARETRELVADFDDAVLVGFKEEAYVAVVDYGDVFVFCGFFWGELDVCVYPSLTLR
jgi:hypothetical protein